MQNKKLLKEASDVMGGSNVSPNAPIQDGGFTNRDEYTAKTGENISSLGSTPEYTNYRKNNDWMF